jgi:redox-sensitive bicupin YhaK (pirin superfamily)
MIILRKANERGHSQMSWLNSFHTFSFAEYYDPAHMGFGDLRVINEDTVQPGQGFGRHSHQNMEIISYVTQGELAHQDSLGTGSIIKPGEIQRMSAGAGIQHSEFNHSDTDTLQFLQIWIIPKKSGLTPSYEQKPIQKINDQLILIGSEEGADGSITIHQDIKLYAAYLTLGHSIQYTFKNKRRGWLQLVKGKITLNGKQLVASDGAAIQEEEMIEIHCLENAELLFFDMVHPVSLT